MGQLKFRPDTAKAGGSYPAGVLGDPTPIAQRFAHAADLRQVSSRRADAPTLSPPARPPTPARQAAASTLGIRVRWLMVALALAALVPNLILLALWLGLIGVDGSEPEIAVPAAPSAVLTASAKIEAIAGEDIDFPIALDGTDGVPARSVVAIRGLPPAAKFSEGRPYGDDEWTLRPDQIGDLALVVPADAHGEFKLGIALIGPDNKAIAEAETLLGIAPAPAPAAPVAVEASTVTSPEVSEPAATAALPDPGDVAGLEEPIEAAAPSGDAPPDEVEPTMEPATAPSGAAAPATVGQPAETGLGTVQPSVFVNLRDGPSSSSPVIGVIAKGVELSVLDRKRGWVQVTDPKTAKTGWIYSGLLAGEAKTYHRRRRAAPAEAEPKSESFWGRVGRWLSPG
jgi:SH3 domain-containing protein